MTPMSMTYHNHVMASLLQEAASERRLRRLARANNDASGRWFRFVSTVRAAAPQSRARQRSPRG
jgi:hypothetical protein